MFSIKVIGAGSIGNHMSHAARSLGWRVDLCDNSEAALDRTRTEIYPGRYGAWDDDINLFTMADAPRGGHDLIVIGTPPDHHLDLAIAALGEAPKALLIEKPLCGPELEKVQEFRDAIADSKTRVFVGYDHVVGQAANRMAAIATGGELGSIETMDVEFREHWGGIFAAHPWLDGPGDSYLGHWRRGGGASGEHSHAANLWQHFARSIGAGRVVTVSATLDYVTDDMVDYDKLCLLTLTTENGLTGRVVQDVVTRPARKWARIQGQAGYVEIQLGYKGSCDAVIDQHGDGEATDHRIEKSRPDDFITELRHIADCVAGNAASPIEFEYGLETMLVVAAAHKSAQHRCAVTIDHDADQITDALGLAQSYKNG